MKLTITQEKQNNTMKRLEVQAEVTNDGSTISREKIKEKLSEQLKKTPELIQIVRVTQEFGSKTSFIEANIYTDTQSMPQNYLQNRGTKKEAKKT